MRGNLTSVHCGNGDHRVRGVKGLSPLKPAYLRGTYCKPACMVPLQLGTSPDCVYVDSSCARDLVHYPGTPSVDVMWVYRGGKGAGTSGLRGWKPPTHNPLFTFSAAVFLSASVACPLCGKDLPVMLLCVKQPSLLQDEELLEVLQAE